MNDVLLIKKTYVVSVTARFPTPLMMKKSSTEDNKPGDDEKYILVSEITNFVLSSKFIVAESS